MTTTPSIAALVDDLKRRGIELRLDDGRLLFKSSGGIPDELRQRMRLNKPALIELLQQGQPTIPEIAGIRLDRMLVLDFETYHETPGRDGYSLSRLTIPEYVADARFKVHGVALRHPDGRGEFRTDVEAALRELVERFGPRLDAVTVVGHNLAFDLYVLAERFGIDPLRTFDTMLASYHVHGRKDDHGGGESASLADLARRYGLGSKGELDFMAGVWETDPDQLARLSEYAINDVVLTYALATKLLPRITNPAIELPLMSHTLRLFSRPRVRVDRDGLGGTAPLRRRQAGRGDRGRGRHGEAGRQRHALPRGAGPSAGGIETTAADQEGQAGRDPRDGEGRRGDAGVAQGRRPRRRGVVPGKAGQEVGRPGPDPPAADDRHRQRHRRSAADHAGLLRRQHRSLRRRRQAQRAEPRSRRARRADPRVDRSRTRPRVRHRRLRPGRAEGAGVVCRAG